MTFRLPTIYPITDRRISGLSHLEQVRQLSEGGAGIVQLREKSGGSGAFLEAALEAVEFASGHGIPVIINDRIDIAITAKAAGVHLGQEDMSPIDARKLLGENAIIGFSTHNVEQARYAATLPVDYIAIGPVFPTRTKSDPDAVVGLDGVRRAREVIGDIQLVAIGGINAGNLADTFEAGADSAAMIAAILDTEFSIEQTMRELTDRYS